MGGLNAHREEWLVCWILITSGDRGGIAQGKVYTNFSLPKAIGISNK